MLTLYTYFRSSAAYRVRIALALKGLAYTSKPVHLVRGGGEQHSQEFAALNPAQLVPVLQERLDDALEHFFAALARRPKPLDPQLLNDRLVNARWSI